MTSQDTGECVCRVRELLILPAGGVPWSLWWLPASSGCTARGWGATGRELGVLGVGGAFVQYAQPLASGSRPSWSRPTRAKSGQLWEGPKPNPDHQTLRRRRAGDGGDGPVTGAPDRAARTPDSLPRGPVSTALTLTGPTSVRPAGIVEILRFLPGVWRRYAFNVSTMDTSDLPGPARPLPFGASSPTGQSTCPGAQLSSLRVRPRRRHGAQRPSRRRRQRNSNNERGLRPANRSEPPSQSSSGKDLS